MIRKAKPAHEYSYSEDRLSLAQEIADSLRSRGYWVPYDWAGSDLILAVAKALDSKGGFT